MSTGPVETYSGPVGVADNGGNSLTEDLNIYYSVRFRLIKNNALHGNGEYLKADTACYTPCRQVILHGS
jgi:hypothetical protein